MIFIIVLYLPQIIVIMQYNIGTVQSDGFKQFDSHKEQLKAIAELGLELYRTPKQETRVFISFDEDSTSGFFSKTDGDEKIVVDERLSHMLVSLYNSDITFYINYIIIGDTYVTFTREGCSFAIMYSEDDIKPKGVWKYKEDDMQIDKYEDYWYELKAHGLGVIP